MQGIVDSQRRTLDEVVVLVNNVADQADARERAEALVRSGELSGYAFVSDHLEAALRAKRISRRSLGKRPYLVDFGLVMPHVLRTRWLLGWDAETRLVDPQNWIDPGLELLRADSRVLHVSLNRPPRTSFEPVIEREAVTRVGDFILTHGFSDHVFLIDRERLIRAPFRSLAPAAVVRHAPHPYTFEYRMESYQRAARLFRAVNPTIKYDTNTDPPGVLLRTGGRSWDDVRIQALWQFGWTVLDRLPEGAGPRFKRYPHGWPRKNHGGEPATSAH
ncbi:hypothetical protein DV701_12875 [Ornithinimicrobium avium]|uniref:Uncharacterized protein n=1 Tax=Ornithinimicrobium avium TaxID=2283195 RepID=A0A345NPD2_9MICO|nr:hypothetical protein DV701_12875 [Ornithinimicrobium avium]